MWVPLFGLQRKYSVRKEPFGLSLSKPLSLPFGLSWSKPSGHTPGASAGSAWPFDKLRANGVGEHVDASGNGEPTVVNSRFGPKAAAHPKSPPHMARAWSG
jgi:hypothetical protein